MSDLDGYCAVAEVLHNNVYSDICWDLQMHVRYNIKRIFNYDFSQKAKSIQDDVSKLKKVIKPPNDANYKLHIIQSNTVQILDTLHEQLTGQVIIQSDPYIYSVIKFQYPEKMTFLTFNVGFYTGVEIRKKALASAISNVKPKREDQLFLRNDDTDTNDGFIFSIFELGER